MAIIMGKGCMEAIWPYGVEGVNPLLRGHSKQGDVVPVACVTWFPSKLQLTSGIHPKI